MVQPLRLSRATRKWLGRLDRKTRDADLRLRCRVLLKVHAGQNPHHAAHEIGCHPATAHRIVARFRSCGEGSVFDGRTGNGERKAGPEVLAGIVEILRSTPQKYWFPRPTWTVELVALVITEELHVVLSVGHVWKLLKRLRVRWGMPRPVVGCPWPAARRQRRLAELKRLALHPQPREVVLYADEVDIHLNPKIGRDWMLHGTQRLVMTPGKNQKHYLAGAYDPRRAEFVRCGRGSQGNVAVPEPAARAVVRLPLGESGPRHPRQRCDPQDRTSRATAPRHGYQDPAALPASVLPERQPHRATVAGSARQRHPQPPASDHA